MTIDLIPSSAFSPIISIAFPVLVPRKGVVLTVVNVYVDDRLYTLLGGDGLIDDKVEEDVAAAKFVISVYVGSDKGDLYDVRWLISSSVRAFIMSFHSH